MDTMKVNLRPGRPEDVERIGKICFEAFAAISNRHGFPPDFPAPEAAVGLLSYLLGREDIYSVVAEVDDRIVGSNFLWLNGKIAGVGPITVDPTVQNASVGKQLMLDVMNYADREGFAGTRLVQAAYHNRSLSLYTKLGFDTREPLSAMHGPALGIEIPGLAVRQLTNEDVAACNQLCVKIHGHDRAPEVQEAAKQGSGMVVERDGRISGYSTMVGFIGHTVGESNEELKALIGATKEFTGPGFLLPTRNSELLRWCLTHGLRVVQPMTLMTVGLYSEPKGAFLPSVVY